MLATRVLLATANAGAQSSVDPAALAREPTVTEVQRAVRHRQPSPYSRLVLRGRWAHVLPTKVNVRFQQDDESDWTGTLSDDQSWQRRSSADARLTWRLEAEWDLSKLVYDGADLTIATRRAEERRRLEGDVDLATRLYFERRRYQLQLHAGPRNEAERTDLWLRIAELTARLDAMCGGIFGRRGVKWWRSARPPPASR